MAEPQKYSWEEIRKHSSEDDAWIVISGDVYNVTDYLPGHPGGAQWLIDWLGKDATDAFKTKGGLGIDHSETAIGLADDLKIGRVAESR